MKDVHKVLHKCDQCEHNAVNAINLKHHIKAHHKEVESETSRKRKPSNDNLPSRKKLK